MHTLLYRKWRNRLTEKLEQSNGQSFRPELKKSTIGIIPCVVVTSLETDAFMAIVAYIDMLKVRSNLRASSRKEGTQG